MTQNLILSEPTQILNDWPLAITVDMVLRGQGAEPQKIRARQPQLVALAERAIAEGHRLIHPQVAFRRLDICGVSRSCVTLRGGSELNGFGIARKLAGCQGVFLAVATLGKEVGRGNGQGVAIRFAVAICSGRLWHRRDWRSLQRGVPFFCCTGGKGWPARDKSVLPRHARLAPCGRSDADFLCSGCGFDRGCSQSLIPDGAAQIAFPGRGVWHARAACWPYLR